MLYSALLAPDLLQESRRQPFRGEKSNYFAASAILSFVFVVLVRRGV
jgi:hypothetical protein